MASEHGPALAGGPRRDLVRKKPTHDDDARTGLGLDEARVRLDAFQQLGPGRRRHGFRSPFRSSSGSLAMLTAMRDRDVFEIGAGANFPSRLRRSSE